uniref:Uncharacterized protein n=1 Tax=Timspurckia oligopyrenoides TaxID=708627 RepID=A0A7S0ZE73_9RHOD|mmetsp:Transcript_1764/g.3149  ORF Transcript_1764/g.3149 Transcript_1764/m.3149 type:complete len:221 (+) Transcript_1764:45-707(+)
MIGFVSGLSVLNSGVNGVASSSFCGSSSLTIAPRSSSSSKVVMNLEGTFNKALDEFKTEYPQFAKRGWGCTAKAERWNGRHAMFGMLAIWLTAYAKGHGLLPSGTIDISQWGPLAELGGYTPITNERAVILIAHVHVLLVSVAATIAPFSFQDKLLLEAGEKDEKPAGLIPKLSFGLNKDAETWNGRLAMVGIMSIVGTAVATNSSILDVTNKMFGGIFF